MVNKVVVGAHYGLGSWLGQRITAVVIALYTVLLVAALLATRPIGYAQWRGLFTAGWMKFATFLFVVCLCYHAWVGMRDIFMDYVKPPGVRLLCHSIVALLLVGYAGWGLRILWSL